MCERDRESEPGSLLAGDSSQDGIRRQETAILASCITRTAPSLPEVSSAGRGRPGKAQREGGSGEHAGWCSRGRVLGEERPVQTVPQGPAEGLLEAATEDPSAQEWTGGIRG